MRKQTGVIPENRKLTCKEVELINFLLAGTNHLELQEQIEKTKVVAECNCGCPTIFLEVEGIESMPLHLHLTAIGVSADNLPVEVILHVQEGLISELEIVSFSEVPLSDLPETDILKCW